MKAIFGVLSLVVVLAVVGMVAKRQLQATGSVVSQGLPGVRGGRGERTGAAAGPGHRAADTRRGRACPAAGSASATRAPTPDDRGRRSHDAPGARPGAERLAGRRSAGRRGDRARHAGRAPGGRDRLQPSGHRPRPDRPRRDRRAAPCGAPARQLPAARMRGLRHARAVRDVRDGVAACARQARRLRRARSQGGRRRLGDRRLRQRRAEPSHQRRGRPARRSRRRGAALVLRREARALPPAPRGRRATRRHRLRRASRSRPANRSRSTTRRRDERGLARPAAVLAGRGVAFGGAAAARRQTPRRARL